MARGRMLNKTISINPEVAALTNELGGLAGLFFTWAIPHLDRDGRISGNPVVLKAQVAPMLADLTIDTITDTLTRAHGLGLIELYDADGKTWACFPKFQHNQQGMRYDREAESAIPEPSGVTPDLVRSRSGPSPEASGRREGKAKQVNGMEGKGSKGNGREEKRIMSSSQSSPDRAPDSRALILEVFAHYRTHHPRFQPKPKSTGKEYRAVKARLAEGYTVADLSQAIDGCHRSPWHMGENDRGKRYDTLELICRDASHVQQFIEAADGPGAVVSEKERRGHRAGDQWLARKEAEDHAKQR